MKIFSHGLSIHYKYLTLTIPFPCLFLSYPYLSLPHLPRQLSPCASLGPFPPSPPRKKKTKSESDLNQAAETLSHKQPSTLFHSHPCLHPSGSREIFGDRTWAEGGSTRQREEVKTGGVQKKGGLRSMCLPPYARWITGKNRALLMACVGPLCRQVEMEEMIAEMLFYWGGCWDLISGNGREVRGAASVCLFAPNWGWEEGEGMQKHSQIIPLMINLPGIIFAEC